jgi:hypothetical protein
LSSEAYPDAETAGAYLRNPLGLDTIGPDCKRPNIRQTKVEQKDTTVCWNIGKRPSPTLKPTVLQKFPGDKYPCRELVGIETVIGSYPIAEPDLT